MKRIVRRLFVCVALASAPLMAFACSGSDTAPGPQTAAGAGGGAGTGGATTGTGGATTGAGGATTGAGGATTGTGGATTGTGGATTGAGGATTGAGGATTGTGGATTGTGGATTGAGGATTGAGGGTMDLSTAAGVQAAATAYKAAHPGNSGMDWDIIACCGFARSEAQILADPQAVALRGICGPGQIAIIPTLAWEYGGTNHPWINPSASAVAYCVYLPTKTSSAHWSYDAAADKVTAEVYVKFPDQNPCKAQAGKAQVMSCLGDPTNIEIFVDTASFHDGNDVGLDLSNSATDLYLVLPDGTRVLMYQGV